jgi:hypothetical protein
VKSLTAGGVERQEAFAPMAVAITLEDEIDASRGDVFVRPNNAPVLDNALEAMVVWMNDVPLTAGRSYLLKTSTLTTTATAVDLRYKMNVETLRSERPTSSALNAIGRVRFECARAPAVDAYAANPQMGAFILIDRLTNADGRSRAWSSSARPSRKRSRVAIARTTPVPTCATCASIARALSVNRPFVVWFTACRARARPRSRVRSRRRSRSAGCAVSFWTGRACGAGFPPTWASRQPIGSSTRAARLRSRACSAIKA